MRSEAGARGSGDGEPARLTVQNDGSIGGGGGRANAADPANFPVLQPDARGADHHPEWTSCPTLANWTSYG